MLHRLPKGKIISKKSKSWLDIILYFWTKCRALKEHYGQSFHLKHSKHELYFNRLWRNNSVDVMKKMFKYRDAEISTEVSMLTN